MGKSANDEAVLERIRADIRRPWREVCELNKSHPQAAELFSLDKRPTFHDPFVGGDALLLEVQRRGLEATPPPSTRWRSSSIRQ